MRQEQLRRTRRRRRDHPAPVALRPRPSGSGDPLVDEDLLRRIEQLVGDRKSASTS